jgi:hypothetical protein
MNCFIEVTKATIFTIIRTSILEVVFVNNTFFSKIITWKSKYSDVLLSSHMYFQRNIVWLLKSPWNRLSITQCYVNMDNHVSSQTLAFNPFPTINSGGARENDTRVPTGAPREKIHFLRGAYMVKYCYFTKKNCSNRCHVHPLDYT